MDAETYPQRIVCPKCKGSGSMTPSGIDRGICQRCLGKRVVVIDAEADERRWRVPDDIVTRAVGLSSGKTDANGGWMLPFSEALRDLLRAQVESYDNLGPEERSAGWVATEWHWTVDDDYWIDRRWYIRDEPQYRAFRWNMAAQRFHTFEEARQWCENDKAARVRAKESGNGR